MDTLSFRYTEDVDVSIVADFPSADIYFENKIGKFMKITYRKGYFQSITFSYAIFSNPMIPFMASCVKMTAKDGSAFLAKIYKDGTSYAIRRKKRLPLIAFFRSIDGIFSNCLPGKDITDVTFFCDGTVSKDEVLINDFFPKRKAKEFDEEKYLKSLTPEERKEYLDDKRIEDVIEKIAKENHIDSDSAEHLVFYIQCMPDEEPTKVKVLNENNIEEVATMVLPLLDKAKHHWDRIDTGSCLSSYKVENRKYTIDRKYIYSKDDFYSIGLDLTEDQSFVEDLFYFFEDEYEQVKDYLNKGIEKVKSTIDQVLPFFEKYVEEMENKN